MEEKSSSGSFQSNAWPPEVPLPFDAYDNSDVALVVERIFLSLTSSWQTPKFWHQDNELEAIDDFGRNKSWQNVVLSRLLEMNLVRLQSIYQLTALWVEPKRIHAVVECEESVLTQAHELIYLFEQQMPPSWERARPMVAWRPVKIRLTQFGLETKSTLENMLASNHPRLAEFRRWHFICGDIVAVRHRNPDGDQAPVRVSRAFAERFIDFAAVPECSEIRDAYPDMKIEEVVIRQRNTMARIYFDEVDPFDGTKFRLSDWLPQAELKAKTAEVSDAKLGTAEKGKARKATGKSYPERILAIVTAWREHHVKANGYLFEPMTQEDLERASGVERTTLRRVLEKLFGNQSKGTSAWERYKSLCQSEYEFLTWLDKISNPHKILTSSTLPKERCGICRNEYSELQLHEGKRICDECYENSQ